MSNIILYGSNGSCSMVAYTLLTELSIPFEDFRMQIGKNGIGAVDGTLDRSAYLKIHHAGYVPALSVDGEVVTENPAIIRYIAGLKPEAKVLGDTLLEQVRVEEWLVWLCGVLHGYGFAGLWRPGRFVEDESLHEAVRAKGMKTILSSFDRIEERIVGPHVLGEKWSAPDVLLHTFWRWGTTRLNIDMANKYPRFKELVKRIEKLPGLRKAMEVENWPLYF